MRLLERFMVPCPDRKVAAVIAALALGAPCRLAEGQHTGPAAATYHAAPLSRVPTLPRAVPECQRSTGRIVGQVMSGIVGAWLGGIVPFAMIDDIDAPDRRVKGDAGYQRSANVAFAVGSWLGSTVGVILASRSGCRFLSRAAIGTAIPSSVLLLGYDEPYLPVLGVVFGAPLQSIAGTIGIGQRTTTPSAAPPNEALKPER